MQQYCTDAKILFLLFLKLYIFVNLKVYFDISYKIFIFPSSDLSRAQGGASAPLVFFCTKKQLLIIILIWNKSLNPFLSNLIIYR